MVQDCLTAPVFGKNETLVSFEIIWRGKKMQFHEATVAWPICKQHHGACDVGESGTESAVKFC
jgi:hypothetical protein